ncbi:DUF116 domain-containing protein [Bacteroidota bacterium]
MAEFNLETQKVQGKTYSLFGNSNSTQEYYQLISNLADKLLQFEPDIQRLLLEIEKITSNDILLNQFKSISKNSFLVLYYRSTIRPTLSDYTKNTAIHLKELSVFKRIWDRRLGTTEKQYHFYMLKIELVNRFFKNEFKKCEYKIALLPHCLKDLSKKCKSETDKFDNICKGCSTKCYLNAISDLLRKYDISPYIWMKADIKKLFKECKRKNKHLGVIGIACIPEVENGMRKCLKAGIPVLGLPLNANRCGRWFGEFYPNSIDLIELENLIG